MRALVTGGADFTGSNLTRALLAAGHEVVVMKNLVATHSLHGSAPSTPLEAGLTRTARWLCEAGYLSRGGA